MQRQLHGGVLEVDEIRVVRKNGFTLLRIGERSVMVAGNEYLMWVRRGVEPAECFMDLACPPRACEVSRMDEDVSRGQGRQTVVLRVRIGDTYNAYDSIFIPMESGPYRSLR